MQINARDFFLAYRKVDMAPHEVLVRILVPFTSKFEFVKEFKQAHRRDDDIAIANAGMHLKMSETEAGRYTAEHRLQVFMKSGLPQSAFTLHKNPALPEVEKLRLFRHESSAQKMSWPCKDTLHDVPPLVGKIFTLHQDTGEAGSSST